LTSIPTLLFRDVDLLPQLEALLLSNEGCQLPCLWGFSAGESTLSDWLAFLENTGFDRGLELDVALSTGELTGSGYIGLDFSPHQDFSIGFVAEEGILAYFEVDLGQVRGWLSPEINTVSVPAVISRLEQTPEIYIFTDRFRQVLLSDIALVLISDEDGLIIYYNIDVSEVQLQPLDWQRVQICLGIPQIALMRMRLQDPNSGEPFGTGIRETLNSTENSSYRSLSEVFDITDEEFIQYFLENPDGCLEAAYLGNH
jgi:hypothetical protein